MARSDDDTWDLASSVGATATMVAAGRALATSDPRHLIDDPFAAPLVRGVGIEFFTKLVDGELDASAFGDVDPERVHSMIAGMALRAKFFDDYFAVAGESGIRQAVILASGLDSRAYRLPWPDGTVVYEIDMPTVIDYKTTTMAELGAQPTATRRTVSIDLRDNWPHALRDAGFDVEQPTAWCAEGLLIYLPGEAQDRLFDNITVMSAPGSMVATEYVPAIQDLDAEKARAASERLAEQGLDLDMPSLVYSGKRNSVIDYLNDTGWSVTTTGGDELFRANGLTPPTHDEYDPLGQIIYVSADLGPQKR